MENGEKIYLVVTIIGKDGKVQNIYHGEQDSKRCPLVSFRDEDSIVVPLWFPTVEAALQYEEKANAEGTEREFWLIQEYTYKKKERPDTAYSLYKVKSDIWPFLDEGETEHFPRVWAHVRSFFICDKSAAEDYVRRFNEDAQKAFEISSLEQQK